MNIDWGLAGQIVTGAIACYFIIYRPAIKREIELAGPDVSSGYSRKNASHLSWVSGGDFGKSDPEAFCAGWEQV